MKNDANIGVAVTLEDDEDRTNGATYIKNIKKGEQIDKNNMIVGSLLFIGTYASRTLGKWKVPPYINVCQILGENVMDFRHAEFCTDVVKVQVFSVLGTMKFILPKGVGFECKGCRLLGDAPGSTGNNVQFKGPRIIVQGCMTMTDVKLDDEHPEIVIVENASIVD